MKMTIKILIAILMCTMLTGCAYKSDPKEIASTPTDGLKTIAPSIESLTEPTAAETEAPTEPTVPFVVQIKPVITETQNQVVVTTADEFLAAIAPNTEIIVDTELIDLSTSTGYGKTNGNYYHWEDTHDGPELFIAEVSNLTICGNGEDHNANVISSVPRYSNVLNFFNCSNIMVKGLTVGHTEEPGECVGGVLFFLNSQDILVEDCGLFGCGTVGVRGENSKDLQIINNDIYDCTVGGVDLAFCGDANIDGNTFRNLGIFTFRIYDCGNVTCNGEPVFDSYHGR